MEKSNFRVGRSKTGLGLFATCPIKKGTYIVDYTGKRIASRDAERLRTRYLFELDDRWTIDGSARTNTARYINHSCKPNAEAVLVRKKLRIRAIVNIAPGDEITYHYGQDYFVAFIKGLPCRCDACASRSARRQAVSTKARLRSLCHAFVIHDGQKPRPLQENATSFFWRHSAFSHCKIAKPRASTPHAR